MPLTKPGTNATYSIDDQIAEARRLLWTTEHTARQLVASGDVSPEFANEKIETGEAIIDTLEAVKATHWTPEEEPMLRTDEEERHAFVDRMRSLYFIDGYQIPELTGEQQAQFIRDPSGYLRNYADKVQSTAIWREIEKRQVKPDAT